MCVLCHLQCEHVWCEHVWCDVKWSDVMWSDKWYVILCCVLTSCCIAHNMTLLQQCEIPHAIRWPWKRSRLHLLMVPYETTSLWWSLDNFTVVMTWVHCSSLDALLLDCTIHLLFMYPESYQTKKPNCLRNYFYDCIFDSNLPPPTCRSICLSSVDPSVHPSASYIAGRCQCTRAFL